MHAHWHAVSASEHACVRTWQGLFQSRSLGVSAYMSYMCSIVYRHIYACRGLGLDSRSPSFNCCFLRCDSILPIYMRDWEKCQFTLPSWHRQRPQGFGIQRDRSTYTSMSRFIHFLSHPVWSACECSSPLCLQCNTPVNRQLFVISLLILEWPLVLTPPCMRRVHTVLKMLHITTFHDFRVIPFRWPSRGAWICISRARTRTVQPTYARPSRQSRISGSRYSRFEKFQTAILRILKKQNRTWRSWSSECIKPATCQRYLVHDRTILVLSPLIHV